MSLQYDPLLLRVLAREITDRWSGRRVVELWMDPDRRRAALRFEDDRPLVFLLHPEAGPLFAGPRVPPAAPGARRSFRSLYLQPARVPADERLLLLELGPPADRDGEDRFRVAVELHTNQWNLLLLRLPGATVEAVLWPREPGDRRLRKGATYVPPAGEREGAGGGLNRPRWRALLSPVEPRARRRVLLRSVAYTSGINAGWMLGEAGGSARSGDEGGPDGSDDGGPDEGDDNALDAAYRRYRELLDRAGVPGAGGTGPDPDAAAGSDRGTAPGSGGEPGEESGRAAFLLHREAGPQPYVHPLDDPDAEILPSLLAGMERVARERGDVEELEGGGEGPESGAPAAPVDQDARELLRALEERAGALRRRRAALRRELEEGADPERLRETGHLLLARVEEIPRGASRVELEGFDGNPREVELDPALGPAENARRYYDEAARRQRALERIPGERERTAASLRRVEAAREKLEARLERGEAPDEEAREALWRLAGGKPETGSAAGDDERLPYRVLRTSGNLEVRVGRSARDNEELTFHHSSPEDVWLHARQVPGSHVVLRWGRREGNPPRRDLTEAAVTAAVNSRARHSGTVAVDWTRRKYVRSPRKSPPGVVVPERVQTLFVRPDPDVVDRMARRARAAGQGPD